MGREAELDRLTAFVAAARRGGGALLVTGEPGVGKTELMDAAADLAAGADVRVIRAAGIPFEAEISFSGLNQVLLPVLDSLPSLASLHQDALNVALGFGEGAPPSRLVVSIAALVLLREAATSRPLLVILDDLPWLDKASAGVLSFVARRVEGTGVSVLGASRAGGEDLFDHVGLPQLEVNRLEDDAAAQLLDSRFPDLGSIVRERILVEAEGNPLALLELPLALGTHMRRTPTGALPGALPLSRRLQALFASRITELPTPTRQLLLRMALDGTGDVRVLGAGAGSDLGLADLVAAEQSRLAFLDADSHRLAFQHPLVRSAVVDLSQAEERRIAHRMLADMWAEQPERQAWHLAEGSLEPDEFVAARLEAAAGRILGRGDAVGCVKALTRSSELSPRSADRQRRLAAAAYIGADVAGDLSNASNVLTALRRGEVEVEGSLQAAVAASAFLLQADGDVATAHRLLLRAIESRDGASDARDPILAEALFSLLLVCTYGGDERLWQPFEDAMARTEGIPLILDLNHRIFADPAHVEMTALEALDAAIATLADEPDSAQIIRIGMSAAYVDRLEGCRAPLLRVLDDARRGGAVASGITAMAQLATDAVEAGDWDGAEDLAAEAIQACESHGYQAATWVLRYVQAEVAAGRGEDERVASLADGIIQWTAPRGMRVGRWFAAQVRGLAALGRGDFEGAYHQASVVSPPGHIPHHNPFALRVILDLVEAAIRTGRHAEAASHVAAMRGINLGGVSSRLALVVAGAAAMVAPDDTALEQFQAALLLPGVERWAFDLARVRLAYGERLRRRQAMVDARVQLNAALETFERLGARPWVSRALAELRASGLAKPLAGDSVLDRLTPQEFEIATLAASGLTNKQIAGRLFLSHRTVSGHLHRAFPKLGVSTRAALRDALASLPPDQLPRG